MKLKIHYAFIINTYIYFKSSYSAEIEIKSLFPHKALVSEELRVLLTCTPGVQ